MTISSSRLRAGIAFLPFGYLAVTRLRSLRDFGYLIVTSWLPPLWILIRLEQLSLVNATTNFLLGYVAFICLYEVGYLVNDAWDASRHSDGRKRTPFATSAPSVALFAGTRIMLWFAISLFTGWIDEPLWLAAQVALVVAMAAHNWISAPSIRLATFAQLAMLRFCSPVAALLSPVGWASAIIVAALFYLPLRFLAYADSKGLLSLPARQSRWFPSQYLASCLPLAALASAVLSLDAILEIWLMLVAAHAGWALLAGQASGAKR